MIRNIKVAVNLGNLMNSDILFFENLLVLVLVLLLLLVEVLEVFVFVVVVVEIFLESSPINDFPFGR